MKDLFAIYETIRIKIQKKYIFWGRNLRRKKLENAQFTIISNNCWGGRIYNSYGMINMSPTIGMIIYPEDFVKLCTNLREYIVQPLRFIPFESSRYYKYLSKEKRYPIAYLGDIELHFLHYHSEQEAKEKWTRRVQRICWNCVIYKLNDQNGCTQDLLQEFCRLPLTNKLCFVCKKNSVLGATVISGLLNKKEIKFSYEPYGRSRKFNVTDYLNEIGRYNRAN